MVCLRKMLTFFLRHKLRFKKLFVEQPQYWSVCHQRSREIKIFYDKIFLHTVRQKPSKYCTECRIFDILIIVIEREGMKLSGTEPCILMIVRTV